MIIIIMPADRGYIEMMVCAQNGSYMTSEMDDYWNDIRSNRESERFPSHCKLHRELLTTVTVVSSSGSVLMASG